MCVCACFLGQFVGVSEVPLEAVDCSNTGVGELLGKPLQLSNIRTPQHLTAKFDLPVSFYWPSGLLASMHCIYRPVVSPAGVCVCVC